MHIKMIRRFNVAALVLFTKTAAHSSKNPPEVHRFVPALDKGGIITFELRLAVNFWRGFLNTGFLQDTTRVEQTKSGNYFVHAP
jgi:hypothetical protein